MRAKVNYSWQDEIHSDAALRAFHFLLNAALDFRLLSNVQQD
jgi:hypothetical protein